MAVRVDQVSIGASSTAAAAYSVAVPAGTGIIAGDLIIVCAAGNGTHVLNGQTCQDSVNTTNFTQIKEQQLGSSSAIYQQTFYYVTPANIPDGSLITFTPYAASTLNSFSVSVFRYALGTIVNAVTSQANTTSTSQAAPALGAAPVIGSLVLTFDAAATGALTPGVAFAAASETNAASVPSTGIGYAIAPGTGTFASTWADGTTAVSATQTVAFQGAGVGVPYLIGNTAQAAGSASTVVTVGSAGGLSSNANDALFCIAGNGAGATVTPTGVTDTKSHTWSLIGSFVAPSGMGVWIYETLHAVTPITVGGSDTVTVAWSGTTGVKNAEVIGCAGINQTLALDVTASASGAGNAPTVTAGSSLANNNELVLAAVTSGSLTAGITWTGAAVALDAGVRAASGVYTSVASQVATSTSAPVMGATLGASGVWSELMVTLLPDPPAGAPATVTVTTASPLTAGQVGVAYTNQLVATGGSPPYVWTTTSGSWPAGLTLASGSGGGTAADFTYIGVNTGPQGGPTLAGFTGQYPALGPIGCYKFFTAGSGLPASWSGSLAESIVNWCAANGHPQPFCYFSWGPATLSAATLNAFIQSIPHTVKAVGFTFDSEPEATWAAGAFITAYQGQANAVHAAQANTPVQLYMMTASYTAAYATGGNGLAGGFIPGPAYVDVYGMDFYDRHTFNVGADMSTTPQWAKWLALVKGFGKPIGITEFGLSGYGTDAAQNTRLQADIAYLKSAFGPGGSVSQLPLFCWLYWNTNSGGINDMLGSATKATWAGVAKTAAGQAGSGGTGGLVSGTPTAAGTSTPTVHATDTNAAFGSKAFSITIGSSSTLAVATASLPGGTVGAAYLGGVLSAAGGTAPYTWAVTVGSLPTGLSLVSGSITGTPSGSPGTASFTVRVTDNVSATATAALSITVSATVTETDTVLPSGTVGAVYSYSLTAAGGTPPYTWLSVGAAIPPGLTFDAVGGTISGTPTTPGTSILQFQVTDDTQATALSPQMPLAIALQSTGNLPVIGRRRYGGQDSDWTFAFSGSNLVKAPNVTLTFWSALSGGTQYTDLQTTGGGAITTVTSDANGTIPEFYGPAGVWKMAADGGGGTRVWMASNDSGDELTTLRNFLANFTG